MSKLKKAALVAGFILVMTVGIGYLVIGGNTKKEPNFRGKPVSYWAASFRSRYVPRMQRAEAELVAGGAAAVPVLEELLLNDSDYFVRASAADCLGKANLYDDKVIQILGVAIREDVNSAVRIAAIDALLEIDPNCARSLEILIAALDDPSSYIRATVVRRLAEKEFHADRFVLRLEKLCDDESERVRCEAAYGLLRRRPLAYPRLMVMLMDLLESASSETRTAAARNLGRLGGRSKCASERLAVLLQDKSPAFRIEVALALWHIESNPNSIAELVTRLQDERTGVRLRAMEALQEIGPEAKTAVPILRTLAKEGDEDISRAAKATLRKLDP